LDNPFWDQIACRRFLNLAAMQKSLKSAEYARLIEILVAARKKRAFVSRR